MKEMIVSVSSTLWDCLYFFSVCLYLISKSKIIKKFSEILFRFFKSFFQDSENRTEQKKWNFFILWVMIYKTKKDWNRFGFFSPFIFPKKVWKKNLMKYFRNISFKKKFPKFSFKNYGLKFFFFKSFHTFQLQTLKLCSSITKKKQKGIYQKKIAKIKLMWKMNSCEKISP